MDKLKEFSILLEKIYSAAINPDEYKGIATEIAKYMGSHSAVIQHRETVSGNAQLMSITQNFSERSLIDYGEHFYKVDEWVIRGSQTQLGTSFVGSDLISRNDFEHSECYADFGRFLGLYDTAASIFPTSNGICAFGVHRDKKDAAFEQKDRLLFNLIIPHLKNSLELRSKINSQLSANSLLFETLSQNGSAVIVVDALLNVKYINGAAESFLNKHASLRVIQKKLHARTDQTDGLIQSAVNAIMNVAATRAEAIRIAGYKGESAVTLKMVPVPGGRFVNCSFGYLAAIFIETDAATISMDESLIQRYRLTRAETRLALAVASGESLRQFSDRNDVGIETVRTQMKQILSKTGTHRQLDFIKLVTSNFN